MDIKQSIPNAITLVNLFCGVCALVCVAHWQVNWAFVFLFIAGWADFFDGTAARILQVKTSIGKELDSLADMVSFGVVPGFIFYQLLSFKAQNASTDFQWQASIGFLVTLFSALRLAKFNTDTRQTENFLGLNTPSSTMFVAGLMLIYSYDSFGLRSWVGNPFFLYLAIFSLCFLLVCELPMFSFKFKGLRWQGNELKISFTAFALLTTALLREAAFSFIIICYVLFSFAQWLLKK